MTRFAVKIETKHDVNGNPRRGWLIYNLHGEPVQFVDEGYRGRDALTQAISPEYRLVEMLGGSIPTTPRFFRVCKKEYE